VIDIEVSTHDSVESKKLSGRCYKSPFVRCGKQWTPLWNLHVHSKHTWDFRSELCDCHNPEEYPAEPATEQRRHRLRRRF
jgi:hypothetical protein